MRLDQAEEFLRAHSTTASVPSAPLSVVQESAAALDSTSNLDQGSAQAAASSGEQQMDTDAGAASAQAESSPPRPSPGEPLTSCCSFILASPSLTARAVC